MPGFSDFAVQSPSATRIGEVGDHRARRFTPRGLGIALLTAVGVIVTLVALLPGNAEAADNQWRSVAYGNGTFVAVASSGTGNRVMTSPDGVTWTDRASAADLYWSSVTYGGGQFVAVAANRGASLPAPRSVTSRTGGGPSPTVAGASWRWMPP